MKVVSTSRLPAIAREILGLFDFVENDWSPSRSRDDLVEMIDDAEAVIAVLGERFDDPLFERCPSLEVVSNFAVGYDNVDVEAATRRGIWVTNTPGVLTDATADLTMALILAVTRRIVEGHQIMRADQYRGWHPLDHLGIGLRGKTLGIVGLGRIGSAVAHRAVSFGMKVVCTTRGSEPTDDRFTLLSLDELLGESDVVSIHCPLTPETSGMFDFDTMSAMKRGAFLVNTARGAIVDEDALCRHLESGHLGGAGLDVYENEPHAHPGLRDRDDVVLLPHIGSATVEARSEMARLASMNVQAVLRGERPPHPVNEPEDRT